MIDLANCVVGVTRVRLRAEDFAGVKTGECALITKIFSEHTFQVNNEKYNCAVSCWDYEHVPAVEPEDLLTPEETNALVASAASYLKEDANV